MTIDPVLGRCLEYAENTEHKMSLFYNRMAREYAEDEELIALFLTLSKDEALHQKQFKALHQSILAADVTITLEEKDYLMAMLLPQTLVDIGENHILKDKPMTREELILEVFRFEKEALGFYQAIMEITGPNPILQEIIEMEKKHVVAAMKILITGTEFTSLQDDWP